MPVIRVTMLEGRSPEVKKQVAAEITETLHKHVGSEPEHIYVIFEDVPATDWAVSGDLFSNMGKEK